MKITPLINWFRKPSEHKSAQDFWPHYLELHKNPKVREKHVAGTLTGLAVSTNTLTAGVTAGAVSGEWILIPIAVLLSPIVLAATTYTMLIPSHKKYGGNQAATLESFKHAKWSVLGDFKMCLYQCMGWLDEEFKKYGIVVPPREDTKVEEKKP